MAGSTLAFPADAPRRGRHAMRRRDHLVRWAMLVAVALLVHLVFPMPPGTGVPVFAAGEVSDRDVVAPFTFEVPKSGEEFDREVRARAAAVRPVYRYLPAAVDSSRAVLERFFVAAPDSTIERPAGVSLTPAEREYLADPVRRRALRGALDGFVVRAVGEGVADAGVVLAESSPELVLLRDGQERVVQRDSVPTFADFVDQAEAALPTSRGEVARRLFRKAAAAAFRASIVPDPRATAARRAQVAADVDPVKVVVPAGAVVVSAREVVSDLTRQTLVALQEAQRAATDRGAWLRHTLAPVLYNLTILSIFWLLLMLYRRETYADLRQMVFFAGLFATVALASAGIAGRFPDRPELLPVPFAAVLVTAVFNGRLGVTAAIILAVLLGGQWSLQDENALYFAIVGGSAAALGVRTVRRRAHLFRTIWTIWGAYVLAAVTLGLLAGWTGRAIAVSGMMGLLNAVASAALAVLIGLPLAEWVTRLTTDLTLIELADPSRPLLRRLATEAPGTYAHSLMLANMCEAAAEAIGANGLLARVGCYYHDVGKLRRPQYYVENQAGGGNPHDKLKPQQSAALIRNHVKDGLELAEEAGLPPVLRAFIPEHHGTATIAYFRERARERDADADLDAAEFRYPGPRPRSAETAITMLGDSTEAAVRVLDEPTPEKVRAAIDHLVGQKLASGQLDEAPLTLRDLDRVKEAFTRVLTGAHHLRVEYPESSGGITADFGEGSRPARG